MSIFTDSVVEGMGLISIAPQSFHGIRRRSGPCSQVRVVGRDGQSYVLTGTSVFSRTPLSSDWMAVGNDLRLGHIRFLIEEGVHGEEERDLHSIEASTH